MRHEKMGKMGLMVQNQRESDYYIITTYAKLLYSLTSNSDRVMPH